MGIPGTYAFTSGMARLCGQPFTVKKVLSGNRYLSEEGVENEEGVNASDGYWYVSADMLEPALSPLTEADTVSAFDLLFGGDDK